MKGATGAPARPRRAVVVGGGLAGITAAVQLATAGCEVQLLESRPRLGGAASSFERDGVRADTGQHVLLRCYTAYRGLLERLGTAHLVQLQDRLTIPVLLPGGRSAVLRRSRHLPAPLHLLPAIGAYAALTPRQRLLASKAAWALSAVDPGKPAADAMTFGAWLREHGQGDVAIRRLWGLVTVAALNIDPAEASLALAAMVFRTGLLRDPAAGDLGLPQAPLSALHDLPVRRLLARLGVRVHLGARVTGCDPTASGLAVRSRSGAEQRTSDTEVEAVVLAVPHQQAAQLVPMAAAPGRGRWAGLGASPIVNLHVHYDRPVMALPFAAAPDSAVQWVFDRTRAAGTDHGQYLVTSISAADAQAGQPADQIRTIQLASLERLFPAARRARVLDCFVTREPRATFRQAAGTAALRPATRTRLPGLVLAGAWTATGWPDTMEGAVRSGLIAAEALLGGEGASTRHHTDTPSEVPA